MNTLKISVLAILFSTVVFAQKQDSKKVETAAVIAAPATLIQSNLKWESDVHDFGDITQNKPVSYDFTFKNTTKETIIISNVKPSCGCTAANYTKTPIKPGEKGVVTATFNANTPNTFLKTVTVTTSETNAAPKTLTIKGNVLVSEIQSEEIR